jgi:ABC-type nickel/cobalt efflux system permease component RcnA
MAAYLVGADGRLRHAVVIGVAVSLMHTLSVVALGLVTLWASSVFEPAEVYPWLALASALAVLGLGGWLLYRRASSISNDGHGHDHGHGHGHGHTHSHDPPMAGPEGSLVSKRGLGAIALSGGLLPSPAALVVLLSAIALGRVVLGLALVAAFSIGLAAALAAVGIVVLRARSFTTGRLGGRTARWLPIASAACVVVLGIVLAVRAVASF